VPFHPVRRSEFKELAAIRLREASALSRVGEWSGVYYLSGYAVECGLKAVGVKQFRASTLPDKNAVEKLYTHDLRSLVKAAGLLPHLDAALKSDQALNGNWGLVKDWNEASRYKTWSQTEAMDMLSSISDRRHGVMKWVRSYW
jgi:hypothetical protein